jgi:hypothetical protein
MKTTSLLKKLKLEELQPHPYAAAFPVLTGTELEKLANSIKSDGQISPIILGHGEAGEYIILDGRNRLAACALAGVAPIFDTYTGELDPLDYIDACNLHRRHLSESQRAMVAAARAELYAKAADARMKAGKTDPSANLRQGSGKAAALAAEVMQVSPRSVEYAVKVRQDGTKKLVEMVTAGEVAVSAAAEVAKDPKPDQAATVAAGPKAVQCRAKAIRLAMKQPRPRKPAGDLGVMRLGLGHQKRRIPSSPAALAHLLLHEWPTADLRALVRELLAERPELDPGRRS